MHGGLYISFTFSAGKPAGIGHRNNLTKALVAENFMESF